MTDEAGASAHAGRPDPRRIGTLRDLAAALDEIRKRAGLSMRQLAAATGIPTSTVGGYLKGEHLPRVQDRAQLVKMLRACGVGDPTELDRWTLAIDRAYGLGVVPSGPVGPVGAELPTSEAMFASLRPPVERLRREPRMRGRGPLFLELTQAAAGRAQPRVHVLHGLGGVGKSLLALNLARWALNRGLRTWWISAGEPLSVALSMRALALQLGVRPEQFDTGRTDVWQLLENLPRPWLLVVDSADDPPNDFGSAHGPVGDATGRLRPLTGRHGTVVVTTRDGGPQTWGESVPWLRLHRLSPLDGVDAAEVLHDVAGAEAGTVAEAGEVATRLGGLPLALRLAGRHLREARDVPSGLAWPGMARTFTAYCRALDHCRHGEVLGTAEPAGAPRARIDLTWELSLDVLAARGFGDARRLLQVLACFGNAPIAYGVLLRSEVLEKSQPFMSEAGPDTPPAQHLWRLLRAMSGFGLVELARDPTLEGAAADTVVLPPVLRAVYRSHPDVRRDPAAHLDLLMGFLSRAARGLYPSNPSAWPRWSAIAVHGHSPVRLFAELGPVHGVAVEDVLGPAKAAAQYLRACGRLVEAESAYGLLLDTALRTLDAVHPEVLTIRQGLCRVRYAMGRWEEAEAQLRTLLADRTTLLGDEHPDTLLTRHYLGRVRLDRGDTAEAEGLFRAVLAARRRVLGAADPATLSSMSNLANVWRATGRLRPARRMLELVLARRRRLLGDDYPSTLITRQHLASLRLDQGVTAADEPVFRDLVDDTGRVLGPLHARSLAAAHLLGEALERLGRGADATSVLDDVLDARRRTLGPAHPATAETTTLLARIRSAG